MRLRIERHRSRAPICWHRLHHAKFLRRFFFQDIRHAFSTGSKDQLRRIIKGRAIHACANRRGPNDFSRLRIEHCHHFVVTGGKDPVMRGIKRDPAWFFTGRYRPMRRHFVLGGIDRDYFAFVFDIHINAVGRGIDRGKFRRAAERNCGHNLGRFGVDDGNRISPMIEDVELTVLGIIEEGIGTFAGLDF